MQTSGWKRPDQKEVDLGTDRERSLPTATPVLLREIRCVLDQEQLCVDGAYRARIEIQVQKWRLIHRYIHDRPFSTRPQLSRSDQWRAVIDYARDLGDLEVLDWVLLQVEVAANIERGVREMRPRKSGPCHEQLLGYAADRKRKAVAVLKWEAAAAGGGANTATTRTLTEAILGMHRPVENGGTENL